MRTSLLLSAVLAALVAAPARAAGPAYASSGAGAYYDYAEVVKVVPIVQLVSVPTTRRDCWDERVVHRPYAAYPGYQSYTPSILGGILGGVVGNQFGSGSGRDAMTVAGALLGASVGRDVGYRQSAPYGYTTVERRCQLSTEYHEEERSAGYEVTYTYNGETYATRTNHDPGDKIRVRVSVAPAE